MYSIARHPVQSTRLNKMLQDHRRHDIWLSLMPTDCKQTVGFNPNKLVNHFNLTQPWSNPNCPCLYLTQVSLNSLPRLLAPSPHSLSPPTRLTYSLMGLVLQPDSLRSAFNGIEARKESKLQEKGLRPTGDVCERLRCPCRILFPTSDKAKQRNTLFIYYHNDQRKASSCDLDKLFPYKSTGVAILFWISNKDKN